MHILYRPVVEQQALGSVSVVTYTVSTHVNGFENKATAEKAQKNQNECLDELKMKIIHTLLF